MSLRRVSLCYMSLCWMSWRPLNRLIHLYTYLCWLIKRQVDEMAQHRLKQMLLCKWAKLLSVVNVTFVILPNVIAPIICCHNDGRNAQPCDLLMNVKWLDKFLSITENFFIQKHLQNSHTSMSKTQSLISLPVSDKHLIECQSVLQKIATIALAFLNVFLRPVS